MSASSSVAQTQSDFPSKKPVQAVEYRLTWVAGVIGVAGPALATFVASTYPKLPQDNLVVPVAVMAVIAASVVAVALVFIADISSRAGITAARLLQRGRVQAPTAERPVEANEFRLTWIAGLVGVVGPALATFLAKTYPQLPQDTPVIPAGVLGVIAVSILSVASVFVVDVRARGAITAALRTDPPGLAAALADQSGLATFGGIKAITLKERAGRYRLVAMRADPASGGYTYLVAGNKTGLEWIAQSAIKEIRS